MPDEYYDGGGVAVPLATELLELDIQAFDGSGWVDEWDSDVDGMPHGIRITCKSRIAESTSVAWSRTSVALDRVPLFSPEASTGDGPADLGGWGTGDLFGGGN